MLDIQKVNVMSQIENMNDKCIFYIYDSSYNCRTFEVSYEDIFNYFYQTFILNHLNSPDGEFTVSIDTQDLSCEYNFDDKEVIQ